MTGTTECAEGVLPYASQDFDWRAHDFPPIDVEAHGHQRTTAQKDEVPCR
jgi:hypothetical protein